MCPTVKLMLQLKTTADFGVLAARLGIGFAFIWPGVSKVSNPAGIAGMLQSRG